MSSSRRVPARSTTSRIGEFEAIRYLARGMAALHGEQVVCGIGDDAAVLSWKKPGERVVWTVDDCVEGVHFRLDWGSLAHAAERALHAAVSDLAAMGARPLGVLVSLQARPGWGTAELQAIRRGQLRAARALECPVLGGNVTRGAQWRFTTTALGSCRRPVLRSSAKPGQFLWLFGDVGKARLGRAWFESGGNESTLGASERRAVRICQRAFLTPQAHFREGQRLRGGNHSAIDISDGLAADAGHLAEASGVRLVLEEARLRSHLDDTLLTAARVLRSSPLECSLFGGEDYALLCTAGRRSPLAGATRIGHVETGSGVVLQTSGRRTRLRGGFQHF